MEVHSGAWKRTYIQCATPIIWFLPTKHASVYTWTPNQIPFCSPNGSYHSHLQAEAKSEVLGGICNEALGSHGIFSSGRDDIHNFWCEKNIEAKICNMTSRLCCSQTTDLESRSHARNMDLSLPGSICRWKTCRWISAVAKMCPVSMKPLSAR